MNQLPLTRGNLFGYTICSFQAFSSPLNKCINYFFLLRKCFFLLLSGIETFLFLFFNKSTTDATKSGAFNVVNLLCSAVNERGKHSSRGHAREKMKKETFPSCCASFLCTMVGLIRPKDIGNLRRIINFTADVPALIIEKRLPPRKPVKQTNQLRSEINWTCFCLSLFASQARPRFNNNVNPDMNNKFRVNCEKREKNFAAAREVFPKARCSKQMFFSSC